MSTARALPAAMEEAFRAWHTRLAGALERLPDKPEETVDATLAALWLAAAGHPCSAAAALDQALPPLGPEAARRLEALVDRRLSGTPLAHLTGRQRFMDLEMLAGPEALIARNETELLARTALAHLPSPESRVVDVCTGSGNVAIAIAHHAPDARVWASDLSADAVALACRNAASLGLAARVSFRVGDLLAPFDEPDFLGRVDMLTCNPPYISSARVDAMPRETAGHEPRLAFDGGPLGIRILRRLVIEAPSWLAHGGMLVFEVGAGQARGVRRLMEQQGAYQGFFEACDDSGEVRVLGAQRRAA
jgi:release factor glutamine methyltransferase